MKKLLLGLMLVSATSYAQPIQIGNCVVDNFGAFNEMYHADTKNEKECLNFAYKVLKNNLKVENVRSIDDGTLVISHPDFKNKVVRIHIDIVDRK